MSTNVALLLQMIAESGDDRIVLGPKSRGVTAAELLDRASRGATQLRASRCANVGYLGSNSELVPIVLFATALARLPFAPLNYRLAEDNLRSIVARLAPGVVIAGPEHADRLRDLDGIAPVSTSVFEEWTCGADDAEFAAGDPDEIAVLLFTSGTTGTPKAAVLRHRHLTSYVFSTVDFLSAEREDAQLISVPAYHIAGIAAILSALYSGRRILYLPSFDPVAWLNTAAAESITHAMVVPTMLGRVLDEIDSRDVSLPNLRHLSYGGGRMPQAVIERAMRMLPHVNFVNAYGLTETSSTISILGPQDHRTALESDDVAVRRRLGSVGRPLQSVQLEIRGPDGEAVVPGQRGEIFVRGEQVAGEYLDCARLTDDGWFPTQDAGHLDDDGFLYLDGRLDDVIVRGAENLSPGEIEDTLLLHPDVSEVAVVGVPDTEWGEAVAAVVVLERGASVTADDLKQWVRHRLRSVKTPALVQFRSELPYNETGKLLRRVLRDELKVASLCE